MFVGIKFVILIIYFNILYIYILIQLFIFIMITRLLITIFIVLFQISLSYCKFGASLYFGDSYSTATMKCVKESGFTNAMYTIGVYNKIP